MPLQRIQTISDKYNRIWRTVLSIPFGRVASYGQIADYAGLPGRARMTGKALGYAPIEIPWHRVIKSNGKIAFPPGSENGERQKALLQQEGIVVINYRVNIKAFGWRPDLAELLMRLEY
ncbi:MAG: MGMT family protein [Gammaproteobacteria bacterium]|nr:MGMT family protein [Gammaproteobacteria bacterium]